MTLKQKLIKEYKDAMYLSCIWELKIKAVPEDREHEHLGKRYASYMMEEDKAISRLRECFSEKDKKYLLPRLGEECRNVAMTHFLIYNMADELITESDVVDLREER